ncbi:hypothetical protein JSY14_02855 [Brachybacterium sp. EF45031]|uniref:LysM peptidoglycan-binding domain-containing protein n=1 Tax=Brachybacterium sillae TaxID=2810536 RepID=UPI00217E4DCC|nr:hypothetical protein [Brachybacterium sillae]MCS6711004.1 hypothetical protein [Brachybacterium sillae]
MVDFAKPVVTAPAQPTLGRALLGVLLATGGALAAATVTVSLLPAARTAESTAALELGLQVLVASALSVVLARLALVQLLTAFVLLSPGDTPRRRLSLRALHLIAPAAARRLGAGVAGAALAGSLALGTAQAAPQAFPPLPAAASTVPTETGRSDPARDSLPHLGWGVSAPSSTGPAAPSAATAPTATSTPNSPPAPSASPPAPTARSTTDDTPQNSRSEATPPPASPVTGTHQVTVAPGDCLWHIADRALGPGAESPHRIERLVRTIHEDNRKVIGDDPDLILPGQVLTVTVPTTEENR